MNARHDHTFQSRPSLRSLISMLPLAAVLAAAGSTQGRVKFPAIEMTALRLEVQLQPNFSSGILEWRLPEEE